jgi:uncharacterized membrane protein YfcA
VFLLTSRLQDLEFNWRLVVATVVGFLGSAFGTVGGVGGGGIFVPLLNLVLGFDTKSAAALSKCKPRPPAHHLLAGTRLR